MAYFRTPVVASLGTASLDATALNRVGTVAIDTDGNEWIYLLGVASVIAGSWVAYDELFATLGLDTDVAASITSPVAVAGAACVAALYGWFGIKGKFSAAAATVADNGKVFATSTVFVCDDASVAGSQIVPAMWRSADASSLATVQIDHPFCGINVA